MSFSTLTLDLHNTIYDEVPEYGLALDEAVSVWLESQPHLNREVIYDELAAAHQQLGSDWDEDAWKLLPSLKNLEAFDKLHAKANEQRRLKSKELTLSGFYKETHKTLSILKERGVHIYVVTEAAANAGMQALKWLKLESIVDGIYTYPSNQKHPPLNGTYNKIFPDNGKGAHLRKPHPFLLASVILDETIRKAEIPGSVKLQDVFAIKQEEELLIPELPAAATVQKEASTRLMLKDTPYAPALKHTRNTMLYVGDSKFRDGLLARNAGVSFGFAAYGKKGHDSEGHRKGLDILYAATGWDKDVMKLTQEASLAESVHRLQPDFIFEDSLAEALELFI